MSGDSGKHVIQTDAALQDGQVNRRLIDKHNLNRLRLRRLYGLYLRPWLHPLPHGSVMSNHL
jgi:hypothetical protein